MFKILILISITLLGCNQNKTTVHDIKYAKKLRIPDYQINKMIELNCLHSNINYLEHGDHTDYWCYQEYKNLDQYKEK